VIYPDADLDQAHQASERLLGQIREAGRRVGAGGPITASVGLAKAGPDDDPASLLRRVDQGTYAAKRAGGDRIVTAA
jgi:PleD family two-component response regulator